MLVEFFKLLNYSAKKILYLTNIVTFILFVDNIENQQLLEQIFDFV